VSPWRSIRRESLGRSRIAPGARRGPRSEFSLQGRQYLPYQLADFVAPIEPSPAEFLPFTAAQVGLAFGPQAGACERDAVLEPFPHFGALTEAQQKAAALGLVDDQGPDERLRRDPDGRAVESDMPSAGQRFEHSGGSPLVDHSPKASTKRLLDLEILRRGFERRLREPIERKLDRLEAGVDLRTSFESDAFGGAIKAILERVSSRLRPDPGGGR
jgi:hypothetical protein